MRRTASRICAIERVIIRPRNSANKNPQSAAIKTELRLGIIACYPRISRLYFDNSPRVIHCRSEEPRRAAMRSADKRYQSRALLPVTGRIAGIPAQNFSILG